MPHDDNDSTPGPGESEFPLGVILVTTGASTVGPLSLPPRGTPDQVLMADSTALLGVRWAV